MNASPAPRQPNPRARRELRVAVAVLLVASVTRLVTGGPVTLLADGEPDGATPVLAAAQGPSQLTLPHPPPPADQPRYAADAVVNSRGIPCTGPYARGERHFRVFYAHLPGQADRFEELSGPLRADLAVTDAAAAETAGRTGGTRHLRLDTGPDCRLRIERVTLPGDLNPTQIRMYLADAGALQGDEKAIVYADWMPAMRICGWSELFADEDPTERNRNNHGNTASVTYTGCLNAGTTGHEVMHALGAVQDGAPNASGNFHCTDEYDRMCYADGGGRPLTYVCPESYDQLFDCNHDDFFSLNPSPGSYLASNWNVANSSYWVQADPDRWDTGAPPAPPPSPSPSPSPSPTPTQGPTTSGPVPRPTFGFDGNPATTERVDAPDALLAAIAVSRLRFDAQPVGNDQRGAAHAVLSRDDTFPDSLGGSSLTGNGPLLFTNRAGLDGRTAEELRRILEPGATVYLLGGEAALTADVSLAVVAAGFSPVRLAGPSRVETSLAVADEVRRLHPEQREVALARAFGPDGNPTAAWADAVTGGAVGADQSMPIVVTPPEALPPEVSAWLSDARPTRTVLFGGTVALSEAVEAAAPNPVRVSGPERTATAVAVATTLWQSSPERRYVLIHGGREDGWAFGLAAAGLAADADAPLLLVGDDVPGPTEALLRRCGNPDSDLLLLGGSGVISDQVRAELDRIDGQAC